MVVLEQIVPQESISAKGPNLGYAEKQLLGSYMAVSPADVYDCQTCNNCGSGNCASCCATGD